MADLKAHNESLWMQAHKPQYEEAKHNMERAVAYLIDGLLPTSPWLEGLEAKKCLFRLNRDLRFSADKRPYKEHFGAYMAPGGKQSLLAGYYLHLEPGDKSMVAGGAYMVPADPLKKLRQEIDYNPQPLLQVIASPGFVRTFGGLQGEQLKTAPKGYPADHPHIALLKHKSFLAMKPVTDQEVLAPDFLPKALSIFQEMAPLLDYLNTAMEEN